MTGNRRMVKLVRNKKGKSANLLSIACQPQNIPVSPAISTRLALLNIRSLVNKSLLVNDVIMTYDLDFLLLSETWLTECSCCAILNDAAPTHFSFMNKPPRYTGKFIDEFAELLSVICTDYNFFIITGDFNIHVDNNMDSNAKELSALLDTFGLLQHVKGPTHNRGHTLDLVISKGVNISSVDVKDLALSDHFCIIPNVQLTSVSVKRRYINENTSATFLEAIAMSPTVSAESVDELLDKFNWKISTVMDAVAPIKTKTTLIRMKTPWRNTMMVKALKTECRKAECKWRKTELQIHHDLYKISLCNFN
ncbi:hypothetical protein N1851_029706 [Merluccius polli]|uniref:Endonuclease/exonuclease/phosphatase domain-containing protein n=1 Tax=Merluccius polli TaxID=89951 RepID=A0AA47NRG7_MERPO|nr:hypothetical protein N1851_029706 [Merluccius polli]